MPVESLGDTVEGDPAQEGLSRGGSSSLPLSGWPSRGRNNVLPHMVFNKKFGKFVAKKGGSAKMMDLQITLDRESFVMLSPPGSCCTL